MVLNETPEEVSLDGMKFVHVHKEGPFETSAKAAWIELFTTAAAFLSQHSGRRSMSMFKCEPAMVYKAGLEFDEISVEIPEGMDVLSFTGGKYLRFTVTGPYDQLPEARDRVFEIVKERNLASRDDYFVQFYGNDMATTPADELITFIHVPIL